MGVIKHFLRLRKQDDRVKVMLILGIVAVVLLAMIVRNVVVLYKYVNTPVEYVLTGNLSSELRLKEVAALNNVKASSLQSEEFVQIKYKTIETGISTVFLSEQYALQVYGIKTSGNMTTYYANEIAFNQLLKELQLTYNGADTSKYKQDGLLVECISGNDVSNIKIMLLSEEQANVIPTDVPYIFSISDSLTLKNKTNTLRVYVDKQDMEQLIVKDIEELGFSMRNREQLIAFESNLNKALIEIRYQFIIYFMSIMWILTLHKYRRT